MLQKPLLKVRDLKDLQCSQKQRTDEFITPFKVKKTKRPRTTTAKKVKIISPPVEEQQPLQPVGDELSKVSVVPATPKTLVKRSAKSARREISPSQMRIDTYFKTCEKTYKIDRVKYEPPTPLTNKKTTGRKDKKTASDLTKKSSNRPKAKRKMGRKRLFVDDITETEDELTGDSNRNEDLEWKPTVRKEAKIVTECITILSDSEEEQIASMMHATSTKREANTSKLERCSKTSNSKKSSSKKTSDRSANNDSKIATSSSNSLSHTSTTSAEVIDSGAITKPESNLATPLGTSSATDKNSKTPAASKRKQKPCPPYKVVEGTTFAVDAFQFGCINNVTHYFLTHFHADHYIGLTRKFAMPLYLSTITARLVRSFIPIEEEYIHELELNKTIMVANVEVTALDANHCPGAIMLLFKIPQTGKYVLHTGDFRAWHGMESEPAFWNNDIHTIYLDTTYISNKYAFSTQSESIDKALNLMDKFREKHSQNRILYVCGSYVIGKEKFWSAIAEEYQLKVWTEANRYRALKAIDDAEYNKLLVEDVKHADMHVISMAKLSYLNLFEYFSEFAQEYDILLAIRPSGWEKDSKPQYRGKINIIGIEYSEHSSFEEMQRFVKFLKPENVISTVPCGRDLMKTSKVPEKWYKYKTLQSSSNYQPRIDQYMGKTPKKKTDIRMPNENKGGLETAVSPIKKRKATTRSELDNNVSVTSVSENITMEPLTAGQADPIKKQLQWMSNPVDSNGNTEANVSVHVELDEGKINTRTNNKYLRSSSHARHIKNEPISPGHRGDVLISQTLTEGESCNIFISSSSRVQTLSRSNSSDLFESPDLIKKIGTCKEKAVIKGANKRQQMMPLSRSNSSELFEPTSVKIKRLHCKDGSSSGEEMPVSQKRITRLASKQNKVPSVASTMSENQLAFQIQRLQHTEEQLAISKVLQASSDRLRVTQSNPLLKSSTSSSASSLNQAEMISKTKRNTKRPNLLQAESEQIPPSQTTTELENTPRPLRNRIKTACSQFVTSLKKESTPVMSISNDLANTARPLRNKMKSAYLWETNGDDDVISASQNSKDLQNTTILSIRNKRLKSKYLSLSSVSTPERSNTRKKGIRDPLAKILEENDAVDMYNLPQSVEALADGAGNKSVEHIPPELLSSSENEMNIIDQAKPVEQKQNISKRRAAVENSPMVYYISSSESVSDVAADLYNTSKLVKTAVDALSQLQPNNSRDHIPSDLLSPTDWDADDDWLY